MKTLTPHIIAEITGGRYVGDEASRHNCVAGAARDNRDVMPGNLFICIRGARADGHDFANIAFDSGAACCLAQRDIPDAKGPYVLVDSTLGSLKTIGAHYRRMFDIPVIGITGSVGKTTSKEMVAAVLGAKYQVLKTPANLNNEIGVPLTLLSMDEHHEAAVIEMGISDFGEMSRLAEMVRPDIFMITRIGYAHLEQLGDLRGVLRAKTEAFACMDRQKGIAVLNGDDELLWGYDPGIRKLTYGFGRRNDYRAENARNEGTSAPARELMVVTPSARFAITIPAYGAHLAQAALSAAVIGDLLGVAPEGIRRGVLSFETVGSRSNVTHTGCITIIDDCYNANPTSMRAAFESMSALPGRRVAVLGDMLGLGADSDELHRDTGAYAVQSGIDALLCLGEKAALILDGYLSAGGKTARHFQTKADMIGALPELILKGDNVLVKASRGMQMEEVVEALDVLFHLA